MGIQRPDTSRASGRSNRFAGANSSAFQQLNLEPGVRTDRIHLPIKFHSVAVSRFGVGQTVQSDRKINARAVAVIVSCVHVVAASRRAIDVCVKSIIGSATVRISPGVIKVINITVRPCVLGRTRTSF